MCEQWVWPSYHERLMELPMSRAARDPVQRKIKLQQSENPTKLIELRNNKASDTDLISCCFCLVIQMSEKLFQIETNQQKMFSQLTLSSFNWRFALWFRHERLATDWASWVSYGSSVTRWEVDGLIHKSMTERSRNSFFKLKSLSGNIQVCQSMWQSFRSRSTICD